MNNRSPDFQRWIDEWYRREKNGIRLAPYVIRPLPRFEGEEEQDAIDTGESTATELRAAPGDS